MHRTMACLLMVGLVSAGIGIGAADAQERSGRKAFFLSLLVPGAGQYYAGERTWAKSFLISEGMLWLGYAGFRRYQAWRENDYRVFATVHAGVNPQGKDAAFFDHVGFYDSAAERNGVISWEEGPEAPLYAEGSQSSWAWDSEASRLTFRSLRSASMTARERSRYVVGGLILNHVMSAIQAGRSAVSEGKEAQRGYCRPDVRPGRLGLVWVRAF
ncbi:MAG: hypothetical protein V1800_10250 [Candidatus Latescibacterota bacterium]